MELITIIVRERSGSTVLQKFIASNYEIHALGEVWNYGHMGTFYKYWLEKVKDDKENIKPNNKAAILEAFLKDKAIETSKTLLIDQKYGHLDNIASAFTPGFRDNGSAYVRVPSMIKFLRSHGSKVIHLNRYNKLRIYVSMAVAKKTGVWHQKSNTKSDNLMTVDIDPEMAFRFVEYENQLTSFVTQCMSDYDKYLEISYEDFFKTENNTISKDNVNMIASFLDQKPESFNPVLPLQKTNPKALAEIVTNIDEVKERFRGSDFEWMLDY